MTLIIAWKDGMVADSISVAAGIRSVVGRPKIGRLKDGTLFAAAGNSDDCYAFGKWMLKGFDHKFTPKISDDNKSGLVILRPNGFMYRCWGPSFEFVPAPAGAYCCYGESDAETFARGALAAGATAPQAMLLAIEHCIYVAGPMQTELLSPC